MHFFHSLDANDIGNNNLCEKGISKNNSTCENAVEQKYGGWTLRAMGFLVHVLFSSSIYFVLLFFVLFVCLFCQPSIKPSKDRLSITVTCFVTRERRVGRTWTMRKKQSMRLDHRLRLRQISWVRFNYRISYKANLLFHELNALIKRIFKGDLLCYCVG